MASVQNGKTKNNGVKAREQAVLSPAQYALDRKVNQQTVYHLMRRHGIGTKEGTRYALYPSDQDALDVALRNEALFHRPDRKNTPPRRQRKIKAGNVATISSGAIAEGLDLEEAQAQYVKLVLDNELSAIASEDLASSLVDSDLMHEKKLALIGRVLGSTEIRYICIEDGYPLYKYLAPFSGTGNTVLYNTVGKYFVIDTPASALGSRDDLIEDGTVQIAY